MLTNLLLKTELYNMVGSKAGSSRSDITAAVQSAIRRAQEAFVRYGEWSFLNKYTDRCYIPLAAPYTTGTVTATQDSKTITGSGTTWTKDMEGSFFRIGSTEWYEIRTFNSTTSLDLAIPFQSSNALAQTYTIAKRFYPLPLDYAYPIAEQAKLISTGGAESPIQFSADADFYDQIVTGKPYWFGIAGNSRNNNYYDVGTVTISTSAGVSTWTFAGSASLPSDVVDRQIRIVGESRAYYIKTRSSSTGAISYETYVNPSDATNTLSTASSYAITPKETQLVGFSNVPDTRYIFAMPYKRFLDEMISDSDISPIIAAGYERAFIAMCKKVLAEDGKLALRGDTVATLLPAATEAMQEAWDSDCRAQTDLREASGYRNENIQVGPSWMGR